MPLLDYLQESVLPLFFYLLVLLVTLPFPSLLRNNRIEHFLCNFTYSSTCTVTKKSMHILQRSSSLLAGALVPLLSAWHQIGRQNSILFVSI